MTRKVLFLAWTATWALQCTERGEIHEDQFSMEWSSRPAARAAKLSSTSSTIASSTCTSTPVAAAACAFEGAVAAERGGVDKADEDTGADADLLDLEDFHSDEESPERNSDQETEDTWKAQNLSLMKKLKMSSWCIMN